MAKEINVKIHKDVKKFKFINDFIKALKNVGHEYYLCHDSSDTNSIKYMERVFAYEFYHQYRKIMERHPCRYNGLYLGGEQTKIGKVCSGLSKSAPDLVLHGSFNNCDQQEWICEIKTLSNQNPIDDIIKLSKRLAPLNFNSLIFCYTGITLENFRIKHSEDITNLKQVNRDIICIFSNRTEDSLEIHAIRLGEILDKINNKKRSKVKG